MAKAKSAFYCTACGFESARWLGRCPSCEAWNTFEDAPVVKAVKSAQGRAVAPLRGNGPVPLSAIDDARIARRRTGMAGFDARLGGARAVYVCGEESAAQTKLRAQRVGAAQTLLVFAETNLRAVLDALERDGTPRVRGGGAP